MSDGKEAYPGYTEYGTLISIDLGQQNDYTAICIVERIMRGDPFKEGFTFKNLYKEYHLVDIFRPELGTPYPQIIKIIESIYNSEELRGRSKAIVIDQTGVGRPVFDEMQQIWRRRLYGITITGGREVSIPTRNQFCVPKRDLIVSLQPALQNGEFRIAKGLQLADTLIQELQDFRVKISPTGHDSYESWREKTHDDIVLSAAQAAWLLQTRYVRFSDE